ncbi:hypothetical protein IMSHALPRED_001194 [Imshaugia aleurites]|uniref:Uncharacterized protein n=1 Tax=Imshaugia aleurites TaxID=172621 RepID=A0A8H3J1N5_9LECA|nr:hypothetical protein IMSHALPRED_001194 [Imshaugia aleurites]
MAFVAALNARFLCYVAFASVCVFLLFSKDWIEQSFQQGPPTVVPANAHKIHNSTLGVRQTALKAKILQLTNPPQFQRIFATIEPAQLEQKIRLKKLASATNVDLTILEGTKSDDLKEGQDSKRCHLACTFEQMSLWRRIVDENVSSALLISSNAVWDERIRYQLSGFRDAAKTLRDHNPSPSPLSDPNPVHGPYGNDWDVLWLGHCGKNGDAFYSPTTTNGLPRAKIWTAPDGRPLGDQYSSTDVRLTSDKPVGELCLSSYAVSYRGAVKLLGLAEDMSELIDQYVEERCDDGDLKCIVQWPQIMGQMGAASEPLERYEDLKIR